MRAKIDEIIDFYRTNSCDINEKDLHFSLTFMSKGFQFKQFYIRHDVCAMKVSEMACLLGVLAPIHPNAHQIADFGTGTGLLACMLAQRSDALITAIEMETNAVLQANENVLQSPFIARIQVLEADIRLFHCPTLFDLIVCNPPFFEHQLKSSKAQKAAAWHDTTLRLHELFEAAIRNLVPQGQLVILLPSSRAEEAISMAQDFALNLSHRFGIHHHQESAEGYVVLGFQFKKNGPVHYRKIVVHSENKTYSPLVHGLLQPFYLYL
ncbi:MAG: methyltransferase [Chitinophagaceae bacterium]|nr:methyltransferase [Chitinophagaceae bacterium]